MKSRRVRIPGFARVKGESLCWFEDDDVYHRSGGYRQCCDEQYPGALGTQGNLENEVDDLFGRGGCDFDASVQTSAKAAAVADALYKAGEGYMGTDETASTNILLLSPVGHVHSINSTDVTKYKTSVEAEFSGDSKRALGAGAGGAACGAVRDDSEERCHEGEVQQRSCEGLPHQSESGIEGSDDSEVMTLSVASGSKYRAITRQMLQ
ncbi:hypothetical protein V7S43_017809 [Phytophthora oleae]|uniref:Uncharacterized protein n=1 Tax=Phytophthora oleae TaxID=2107226 RepID=A0ABD3ET05_9STRA